VAKPGIPFEEAIREELELWGTQLSGGKHSDADGREPEGNFILECKDEGGLAIRFPYDQLLKVRHQAMQHGRGNWVRAFRNGKGDVVISMNYKLFKQLYEIAKESGW